MQGILINKESVMKAVHDACKKVAPVWPLENFVAVNPYLGLSNKSFNSAAQELSKAADIQMTLPIGFYLEKIEEGIIRKDDISQALARNEHHKYDDADHFIQSLKSYRNEDVQSFQLVADIAADLTGKDWSRYVKHGITTWAAAYFDQGQASWKASFHADSPFRSWKQEAEIDRTADVSGLRGFRKMLKSIPSEFESATAYVIEALEVSPDILDAYLYSLLMRYSGWAAYFAKIDWDAQLKGNESNKLSEYVAILLCWELGLLACLKNDHLKSEWEHYISQFSESDFEHAINGQLTNKLILQEAFDLAKQRELVEQFNSQTLSNTQQKQDAKAQAIFCIDVRSEVFRRNLEYVDEGIETLGFAGFFGFPIKHVPIGQEEGDDHCPALITTSHTINESISDETLVKKVIKKRKIHTQFQQLVKTFKSGAITCFSFVSPLGLSFLPKLFTDSFGWTTPVKNTPGNKLEERTVDLSETNKKNQLLGIPNDDRVAMAKNALKSMSLIDGFGEFVLIVGHAADMVNNPHASGYDCGACGGRSGEPNAKVAVAVLNDPFVRNSLNEDDIVIPDTTIFMAGLHNTTTDEITFFNEDQLSPQQQESFKNIKESFAKAGHLSRVERLVRFNAKGEKGEQLLKRTKDWSQLRPEWGLAGCNSFVVASRERTKHLNLGGKTFLHSYNWRKDDQFKVLESIMTAPMVVTNWINLQYYASTVDNLRFGAGNKTLHNVSAGIGVLEGYSGDLRVGLPWQAIHDGDKFQHEPVRLKVIIEAPVEAMNEVLNKHENVKELCDNGWLQLLAMNEEGKVENYYAGNLRWEPIEY